jgi:hypothetical protein
VDTAKFILKEQHIQGIHMEELKQRKLFNRKKYNITEKGVHITEKSLGSYDEATVPFEKITDDVSVFSEALKHNLGLSVIFS